MASRTGKSPQLMKSDGKVGPAAWKSYFSIIENHPENMESDRKVTPSARKNHPQNMKKFLPGRGNSNATLR